MTDGRRKSAADSKRADRAAARRAKKLGGLKLFEFEHRNDPLLPLEDFWSRLARSVMWGFGFIAVSLLIGVLGYHWAAHLGWVDAILNASMILTGMGPVDKMETDAGKLFAAFYALYSGLVFLTMIVVLITPVYHRFIHRFHLESEQQEAREDGAKTG